MSTTTFNYRSTTKDFSISELRAREAQKRTENRIASQLVKKARKEQEKIEKRINNLNHHIQLSEEKLQNLTNKLDENIRKLPDLTLTAPRLSFDINKNNDIEYLESYESKINIEVQRFEHQLDIQIQRAKQLLKLRIKKANIWKEIIDKELDFFSLLKICEKLAAQLSTTLHISQLPIRPKENAELEELNSYLKLIKENISKLKENSKNYETQIQARKRAIKLVGKTVNFKESDEAIFEYHNIKKKNSRYLSDKYLNKILNQNKLKWRDLPESLRLLISNALDHSYEIDWKQSIVRWLAIERKKRDDSVLALKLLQNVPDGVHESPLLSLRWKSLTNRLQQIASGLQSFTSSEENEYQQICKDSVNLINSSYTKTNFIHAMNKEGFNVFEQEDDENKLVIIDPSNLDIWLEGTEMVGENKNSFSVVLEMKTDSVDIVNKEDITEDICEKLNRAFDDNDNSVNFHSEIIEHKHRLQRARRPKQLEKYL